MVDEISLPLKIIILLLLLLFILLFTHTKHGIFILKDPKPAIPRQILHEEQKLAATNVFFNFMLLRPIYLKFTTIYRSKLKQLCYKMNDRNCSCKFCQTTFFKWMHSMYKISIGRNLKNMLGTADV